MSIPRKKTVSLTPSRLVGYQLAEFDKSSRLRIGLFVLQLMLAVPAALSVVIADETSLYALAIFGGVGLTVWWLISLRYDRSRNAAQTARRASLLSGALGETFSPFELAELRQRFTVTETEAAAKEDANYYASKKIAGPERLAEMLEESAFFTADLQDFSSKVMGVIFVFFILIAGGIG
jgi:hypothetical protein